MTEPGEALFPVGQYLENENHTTYGITPADGEFIFIKVVSPLNRVVVVTKLMDEVDRLLPRLTVVRRSSRARSKTRRSPCSARRPVAAL
ncbi:MAG: hypothetical protein ACKVZ0_20645 [Gemmatimonadales bacterium]